MGKVKIHVLYCGGWGYEPKFEAIKVRNNGRTPMNIDITSAFLIKSI